MPVRLRLRIWGKNAWHFWRMPFQVKYYSRSSRIIFDLTAAALVLFLTLLIMPLYTDGDQAIYREVYRSLPKFNLSQGFIFYINSLSSREPVHFFLSWIASRHIEKDLFVALSNAFLAYVAMSLFQKWKASVIIAFLLLLTNYYFFVLYFSAERLKYGFIFLALSMIYVDQVKCIYGLATLALVSHAQVIIVYVAILFKGFVRQMLKLFLTGKVSKWFLYVPLLFIPPLFVANQIIGKLQYYQDNVLYSSLGGWGALGRIFVFLLLALWYSKRKRETILLFVPLVIAVFLLGGERINIFGYFIFLYYGLQFRGGWNLGVLATSAYFAHSSIGFLVNIMQRGSGF